jgi:hypothetical protein
MDFPEGIAERRRLVIYTFALVKHPHLLTIGPKQTPPLKAGGVRAHSGK